MRPLNFTVSGRVMTLSTFSLFQVALLLAPALTVAVFSWAWWSSLARPWLFLVVGLIVLYVSAAAAFVWVLTNVGIAGGSGRAGAAMLTGPPRGISPVTKALVGLFAVIVGGSAFLWCLRRALGVR